MTGDGLLQRAREKRGITRAELGRRLDVDSSTVGNTERRGATTSVRVLDKYGRALGLTLHVHYVTETGDIID